MIYVYVLVFQILFNIFKVLEIRYTFHNQVKKLLMNSVWINLVSLGSTFYSIDALLKGDFWVIIFYIVGSVIGKYIGMKIDVNGRGFSVSEYLY